MADDRALSALTLQDLLYQRLREQIDDGSYRPGDKLPAERELSETYQVSRVTVRAALAQLVADGLIVKRQGKGAFVRQPMHVESDFSDGSFTTACLAMGSIPATRVLSAWEGRPEDRSPQELGLEGERLVIIERLRLVDGEPCILEIDYLPPAFRFLLAEELEDASLLRLIFERTGMAAVAFSDQFGIVRATKRQAEALECSQGRPLLEVRQTVLAGGGRVMYANTQLINTERYVYAVRSAR